MDKGPEQAFSFFQRRHTDDQQIHEKILNTANYQRNINQNYTEVLYQSEQPPSKSLQIINAGEGMEKREPLCTVGGNVNWCSH